MGYCKGVSKVQQKDSWLHPHERQLLACLHVSMENVSVAVIVKCTKEH